jgi:hypothetical protein
MQRSSEAVILECVKAFWYHIGQHWICIFDKSTIFLNKYWSQDLIECLPSFEFISLSILSIVKPTKTTARLSDFRILSVKISIRKRTKRQRWLVIFSSNSQYLTARYPNIRVDKSENHPNQLGKLKLPSIKEIPLRTLAVSVLRSQSMTMTPISLAFLATPIVRPPTREANSVPVKYLVIYYIGHRIIKSIIRSEVSKDQSISFTVTCVGSYKAPPLPH